MITGNEYAMPITENTGLSGLTIFQELSARFMGVMLERYGDFEYSSQSACQAADALINEWNKREQSKTK